VVPKKVLELDQAIKDLKASAERVLKLAEGLPVAEKNAYMILRQVEMLEIEISDPVTVLAQSPKE